MNTSTRSLGDGRQKGKSLEEEFGCEHGHWKEVTKR
jgi:hypothetical protein